MALVWDFAQQVAVGATPGNTYSYFDEMTQAFYASGGALKTKIGKITKGQWGSQLRETELSLLANVSVIDVDHESNGYVLIAAQLGSDVVLLMYDYLVDVSSWLESGTWKLQPDNPIKAGSISLKNADKEVFRRSPYTLFSPGARLRLQFYSGDSDPYNIGMFYIDTSPFAEKSESFTFTGRNSVGFLLSDQLFDELNVFHSITRTDLIRAILGNAGVTQDLMIIQADSTQVETMTFEDDSSYLKGLQSMCDLFDWYFDDLPDGRIVVGDENFVKSYVAATGIYEFEMGNELYSKSVDRSASDVYSRVAVKRQGDNWRRIFADLPYYSGWFVGNHRTYYQSVPDETSNEDMDRILQQLVEGMQYLGITESFSGPFRPYLQSGDVAKITEEGVPRLVGIITDITHTFGRSGYKTDFTVTSGGTINNPDNSATIATRYKGQLSGANRKRRLLDYLKVA